MKQSKLSANITDENSSSLTIANRYQIEKQLSKKAGRSTYLAKDLTSNHSVVIKVLEFNSFFQWDDLKLFEREAKTLKNISHPAIPKYLDYVELDDDNFRGFALVQTYIDALSLEDLVREGCKFSAAELIELADKLLDILIYLHQKHPPVIHRDLKPSNILINNRSGNSIGEVYLVDFGSVQTVANKDNGTITIVGSYGYIPLEQFGGQTTTASDLYSLGMTLIYLITGVHPAELTLVKGRVKFNSNLVGKKFIRWLEKMTEPHLKERFESATIAKKALFSKEIDIGKFSQLKPKNTKVKIYCDRDVLEITYLDNFRNKTNYNYTSLASLFLILSPSLLLGLVILIVLSLGYSIVLFCYILGFLFFLTLFVFYKTNKKIHRDINQIGKKHYRFINIYKNNKVITQGSYFKNSTTANCSSYHYNNLDYISYCVNYNFNEDGNVKVNKTNRMNTNTKISLTLHCDRVRYSIISSNLSGNDLSRAELLWLGEEISNFLGIELKTIYPTSKVSNF